MKPVEAQRLLENALAHHRAGRLADAEAAYRRLLQGNPRHADATHLLGLVAYQRGEGEKAVRLILAAIQLRRDVPDYHNNLGEAYRALGRKEEARAAYTRALQLNPGYATAWNNLGIVLETLAKSEEAQAAYEKALRLKPDYFEAWHNFGVFLDRIERSGTALEALQQALRLAPRSAQAYSSLGNALQNLQRFDEALAAYDRALQLDPGFFLADYNRGNALQAQEKFEEAALCYAACLAKNPAYAEALNNFGHVLIRLRQPEEAVEKVRRALALNPNLASAWNNLGTCCLLSGRYEEARSALMQALTLEPASYRAYSNLGLLEQKEQHWPACIAAFEKAIALKPDFFDARVNFAGAVLELNLPGKALAMLDAVLAMKPDHASALLNRANVLMALGRGTEALPAYLRALEHEPARWPWWSNYLYALTGSDAYSAAEIAAKHFEAGRIMEATTAGRQVSRPGGGQQRTGRIRVGFVSPDLREHSVARFLEPLWRDYDREKFSFHAYADVDRPDRMTDILRGAVDGWRDILGVGDEAAARIIAADEIDILIDLAGHTRNNRLRLFSLRPARIQASWLGYPNTTGLTCIDFRLTDGIADPVGMTERLHVERLIRIAETAWCYAVPRDAPAVGRAPGSTSGAITFCSFNNPVKYSRHTIQLWSRVLQAVPTAELLLKGKPLADVTPREELLQRFAQCGIPAHRLDLRGWASEGKDHFAAYHEADVALDTFPYHGTTTTCEALWMGVPVISRAGDAHVARVGASLLNCVGLRDLVAESDDDFVSIALRMAADPARLGDLRRSLRDRMQQSALMNSPDFARRFGRACEEMIRETERR